MIQVLGSLRINCFWKAIALCLLTILQLHKSCIYTRSGYGYDTTGSRAGRGDYCNGAQTSDRTGAAVFYAICTKVSKILQRHRDLPGQMTKSIEAALRMRGQSNGKSKYRLSGNVASVEGDADIICPFS